MAPWEEWPDRSYIRFLPHHIGVLRALGGQGLTGENVALMVAFQSLVGKVFSNLCHINSPWDFRRHPVQPSCFAEEEPEGQRGKVASLSVAGQGLAGPLAPCPHRRRPPSGVACSLPDAATPPLPATGASKGPVTRVSPQPPQDWGGTQRSFPSHVAEPGLGQDQALCKKQDRSEWPWWGAKPIISEKPAS